MICPECKHEVESPCYMGAKYFYKGMPLYACPLIPENKMLVYDSEFTKLKGVIDFAGGLDFEEASNYFGE